MFNVDAEIADLKARVEALEKKAKVSPPKDAPAHLSEAQLKAGEVDAPDPLATPETPTPRRRKSKKKEG